MQISTVDDPSCSPSLKPSTGVILMKFLPASAVTLLLLLCYRLLIRSPRFEPDDAYIIHLASTLEWQHFLYIPAIYQQLSAAHLTPLTVPFYSLIQSASLPFRQMPFSTLWPSCSACGFSSARLSFARTSNFPNATSSCLSSCFCPSSRLGQFSAGSTQHTTF